ncbi:MAG TPA: hypothetical protein VGK98_03385 [Arthrobacter sp.]
MHTNDARKGNQIFTGHVARATNAHEEMGKNNQSIQESKEAPGHTTGQQ